MAPTESMITSADIEKIMSTHEAWYNSRFSIYLYGTYALIKECGPSDDKIHIPGGHIVNISYDAAITLPGFQAFIVRDPKDKFVDYSKPLTKKWALELRIAEYISYNAKGDGCIEIFDDYVILDSDILIKNDEIYVIGHKKYYLSRHSLFGSNILCLLDYQNLTVQNDVPKSIYINKIEEKTDTLSIYKAIVDSRARGFIRQYGQLCDITVSIDH